MQSQDKRVTLMPMTRAIASAMVSGTRDDAAWSDDFPADGDLQIAAVHAKAADVSDHVPWAHPWLVQWCARSVGTAGFVGDPADGVLEIGYGIVPSARRRGVATAAVATLLGSAWAAGLTEVRARTAVDNMPSSRIVEGLGFRRIGRDVDRDDGDVIVWALRAPR